jgi:alpha-tubulin suppressor-like RCC1 family protein
LASVVGTSAATASVAAAPATPWAWGYNLDGELGNGTNVGSATPLQVSGLGGVTAIAAGLSHSLAVKSDGTAWAWGFNAYGQLGNGTTTNSSTPVEVSSLTGVTAIAGGSAHSLAAKSDGTAWAWGNNFSGQLGNGTTTNSTTPLQVSGLTGVTAIAGGFAHSLAAKSDGTVWGWGYNHYGQLGNGTNVNRTTPVQASGLSGVTAVASQAQANHSLALKSDGTVWAWGLNNYGQLGNGTTNGSNPNPTAVQVSGVSGVSAIAAGASHSLALKTDGTVWAWGLNFSGQLGNGTTTNSSIPVQVSGLSEVTAIAAGSSHSLAVKSDGTAWAWGYNAWGQLGNGTTTNSSTPVKVTGLSGMTAIAGGDIHSVALTLTSAPVAVLPAMANGAYGGYTTVTYVQNVGSAPAHVTIQYVDTAGTSVGVGDTTSALAVNGVWTVRQDNGHSFAPGGAGSAIVSSDQPVDAFVNEFPANNASDATSYTAIKITSAGTSGTLYAPAIASAAYGGYTTGIGLVNMGTSVTDVTIRYRDLTGAILKTQILSAVPAGAYRAVYSGDSGQPTDARLVAGFAGTATISAAAGGKLAAIVNEVGPGGQFSSYDAVTTGNAQLAAPVALNEGYGGYFTGIGVQNTTGTSGTVTVTYYDTAGAATVKTFQIAANGYLGIYQGYASDGPPPSDLGYTATISSTVAVAAIVNEVAPDAGGGARQSTSYNTFPAGFPTVHLPLLENAGSDGWSTGLGVMNTGITATTVTLNYYDAATGATVGTQQTQTIQPKAFWGPYQPAAGLPSGIRATAVLTTSSGGQVAVIANESNANWFMSYDGQ